MKRVFSLQVLLVLCFYTSCKSQGNNRENKVVSYNQNKISPTDIDSIYLKLSKGKTINYKKIDGQFVYIESDEKDGKVLTRFIPDEFKGTFLYTGYSDDRNDLVTINKNSFNIKSKLDPTSIVIYQLGENAKKYFVLIGKAQSASGSGVQITFFILAELNEKGKVTGHYEFESRFGDIYCLVDYNQDGALDYFKIINGKNLEEYLLTVNNVKSKKQIDKGYMLLKYEMNDKFIVMEDQLSDKE